MTDKNYLKAVSCFNFGEYQNACKGTIKFKVNDNLDYCGLASCEYYTSSPEIAGTISNTPWEAKPFPFSVKVLKCADGGVPRPSNVVQRIFADGEWRRRQFANSLSAWWGEWVNIEKAINDILNNENIQKFLTGNWDRYMVIDESSSRKKRWEEGHAVTIDEIIKQIRNGTAKILEIKSQQIDQFNCGFLTIYWLLERISLF